ncbi:hypothetical protein ACSBR2_039701 [Camellia fascicularis]
MATETNAQTSTGMVTAIAPTPPYVQQKMLFYLTTLILARFLRDDAPTLKKDEIDQLVVVAVDACKTC